MPALSFRAKLILAMSIIVLGVTSAAVVVTQQRVQATYQRLFEAQFRMAIDVFSERQRARLESVRNLCKAVTRSVRLIAAMNANEPARVYDDLLQTFRDSGRTGTHGSEDVVALLDTLASTGEGSGPGGGLPREAERPFIRVLDPQGDPLATDDPRFRARQPSAGSRKLVEVMRHMMARVNQGGLKEQEVGYLAIELEEGPAQLREFILTPIIDPAEQRTLGALVIGLPLSDLGEKEMNDPSRRTGDGVLLSGIWLGGQLHTRTIPGEIREMIGLQIGREIERGMRFSENVTAYVNGVEHRVVFKVLNPDSPLPPACQVGLYSLAGVRAEQRDLRLRIIGFGILALLGALVLILFISHGLTVPIKDLVRGTAEVRQGNFEIRVPVRSRDEIGQLTTSFNEMAAGLALSRRYQSVLAQVADKEVAEALMLRDGGLGGEVREVTVLFCDIRGFSTLTQHMPPAGVIALLNEHMTALTAVVYEHNGVVDKFVGDMIMAVFGAPKSCGNAAHNAARCAIRMLTERERLNHAGPLKIAVGIGVATGEVIAGCMGSRDRLNYTVLGQRVNLAARLCAQAGRMEVFIDDATREKLGALVDVEAVPDLVLKGFTDPVPAFKLKEVRSPSRLA